ncbi:hypothetical protein CFRS1_v008735 [Colletotrichum fructicola]|nr:hypothetical protein CFRS1_v008735 [Colletotrichum fructicola]
MNDLNHARQIVRAYSFEVEERLPPESDAHGLAHILAQRQRSENNAQDPWRPFFESVGASGEFSDSNPITQVLAVETSQLREKWKVFIESSTARDRINIQLSEPTMNGVIDAVHEIQRAWDSKRSGGRLGRAKQLLHQFCRTLKSHQSFLEILPSGNEYVSIFTGTLNVLIQASANHEKIAEGLSESLCIASRIVSET